MIPVCPYKNPITDEGCQFTPEPDPALRGEWATIYCEFHRPLGLGDFRGPPKREWSEDMVDGFNNKIFNFINEKIQDGERIDLSGVEFPGYISFNSIDFRHAKSLNIIGGNFFGDIDFSNVYFGCDVDFQKSYFREYSNFRGAQFLGNACFDSVNFLGGVDFSKGNKATIFHKTATFFSTNFYGERVSANFSDSVFLETVTFRAQFHNVSSFIRITVKSDADFCECVFAKDSFFCESEFNACADFSRINIYGTLDLNSARFYGSAEFLSIDCCGLMNFENVIFFNKVDFYNTKMIRGTNFKNTTFFGIPLFSIEKIHETIDFGVAIFKYVGADATLAYTRLRHLMAERRYHPQEAMFFALEKRCERKKYRWYQFNFWISALYDWTSAYGSSMGRPVIWFILLFVLFMGIYGLLITSNEAAVGVFHGDFLDFLANLAGFTVEQITRPFAIWSGKYQPLMEAARVALENDGFLIRVVSSFQSVVSLLLLFSLGVAVRWRFRRA